MLPESYQLVASAVSAADFLRLRTEAGLTAPTAEQARLCAQGAWAACHVRHETDGVVAMGRVIGDGGYTFHVCDMAVLPDHQRRGLGDAVLAHLLERIDAAATAGSYVSLGGDPPGRRLYARHGFVETAPATVAMAMRRGPGSSPPF